MLLCLEVEVFAQFTEQTNPIGPNSGGRRATAKWIDTDNDNDLDLAIIGSGSERGIYVNDNGSFTLAYSFPSTSTSYDGTYAKWTDFDNDGFIDVAYQQGNNGVQIYQNDGDNTFTLRASGLPSLHRYANVDVGDFNNDGLPDLITMGDLRTSGNDTPSTRLYRNDGNFTFTQVYHGQIVNAEKGAARFADVDNDGLLDVIIVGINRSVTNGFETGYNHVYKNTGEGFTFLWGNSDGGFQSSMAIGDYNSDGFIDYAFQGAEVGTDFTYVYLNNGGTSFTRITGGLRQVDGGYTEFIDYDMDGDLDLYLNSRTNNPNVSFAQNTNGSFSTVFNIDTPYNTWHMGDDAWGDYDGDGKIDVFMMGSTNGIGGTTAPHSALLKSHYTNSNTPPTTPVNPTSSIVDGEVMLSWLAASDSETPTAGLTYNVRVGTSPGAIDVVSPLADISTGWRKVVKLGNAGAKNFYTLRSLPVGTYYWSVQAIDNSYVGSSFSSEGSFTITEQTVFITLSDLTHTYDGNAQQASFTTHIAGVNVVLTYDGSTTQPTQAGTYTVTGMVDDAGFVGSQSATFTINQASLTARADNIDRAVGYPNPPLTITYTGFVNSEDVSVLTSLPTASTIATIASPIGAYPITLTGGSADNYSLSLVSGTLNVVSTDGQLTEQTALQNLVGNTDEAEGYWVDVDNDNDLDLCLIGEDLNVRIYKNNNGTWSSAQTITSVTASYEATNLFPSIRWADFNNDGFLDLAYMDNGVVILQNNGDDTYTSRVTHATSGFTQQRFGALDVGDFNNDGLVDIVVVGAQTDGFPFSRLYQNGGSFSFTEVYQGQLEGVQYGNVKFADFDNDDLLDVVVAGSICTTSDPIIFNGQNFCPPITIVYKNTGDGFSILEDLSADARQFGAALDIGDYNSDGYLDFYMQGEYDDVYGSVFYQNNGGASFTSVTNGLVAKSGESGDARFVDYDMDGDLDIQAKGFTENSEYFNTIAVNAAGLYTDTEVWTDSYARFGDGGRGAWGDYDNDGRIDFYNSARGSTINGRLYKNTGILSNSAPAAPTVLSAAPFGFNVTLSWLGSTDDRTPSNALTYNVRVGTSPGGEEILSSESDLTTGYRRIAAIGNAGTGTSLLLKDLASGTYYWSVQAVDNGYAGSPFASEGSFVITPQTATVTLSNLSQTYDGTPKPVVATTSPVGVNLDITYDGGATVPTDASSYTVMATVNDPGFTGSASGTLEIAKAPLTVTADDQSRTYGADAPTFTLTYSGFQNGEDESVLDTQPSVSSAAVVTSDVGTYDINLSGGVDDNYELTLDNGTLTIIKAGLGAHVINQTQAYGGDGALGGFSFVGFVNGEDESVLDALPGQSSVVDALSPVGSYPINSTYDPSLDNNYDVFPVSGMYTVNPADLTVIVDDQTRTYGAQDPELTFSYSGFVNGENESILGTAPGTSTAATATSIVGDYPITIAGGVATNYNFIYQPATLSITKASLSVTAEDKTRTYGDANPELTLIYSGFQNGEDESVIDVLPSINTLADVTSDAGDHTISLTGGTDDNYNLILTDGNLGISKRFLFLFANPVTQYYGETVPLQGFDPTASLFVNGDDFSDIDVLPTISTPVTPTSPVGNYVLVVTGGSDNNYTLSTSGNLHTVDPAPLTVTAADQSRIYGVANPSFTFSYSGFMNGENESSLDVAPTTSSAAMISSNVGDYPITVAGGVSNNYDFSYQPGTLSITSASLIVKAEDKARTYGDTNPVLTVIYSGFQNGEDETVLSSIPSVSTSANAGSPAGAYSITLSGVGTASNYAVTSEDGTLTISKVTITATADDQNRVYGDANPVLTFSYSGFVNGEDITAIATPPSASTIADQTSDTGDYPISGSGGSDNNYDFVFVDGNLTITKRDLLFSPFDINQFYGESKSVMGFDFSTAGFVNGENENDLDMLPALSTPVTSTSPAGTYNVAITGGMDNNYSLIVSPAFHYVNPAPLTVTADDQTKLVGEINPSLTFSYSGFVNGEDEGVLNNIPSISTTATTGSPAGTYPITLSGGSADNYDLTLMNGALTVVTRTPLTITVDPQTKTYGDPDPSLTYQLTSGTLAPGDAISGSLSRVAGEDAGTYAIEIGTLTAGASYEITLISADLDILPRPLTVRTDADQTKVYGESDPVFTYSVISGVLAPGDNFTGMLSRAAGENVNNYAIQQGTLTAGGNYAITFIGDDFEITPRGVTVTVDANQSKVYGQSDPASFTYIPSPALEAGDSFTGALTRATGENVNTYMIQQGTLTAGGNYAITFIGDDFEITPRGVTVTVDANQSKVYGQSDPANFTYTPSHALETGDSFIGALTRVAGEDVDTYTIQQGTLTAGNNYAIIFNTDDFEITPRGVSVTVDPGQTKVYGQADPASYTYTSTPILETGDSFTGALTRVAGEDADTYSIQPGTLTAGSNYSITFNGDDFSITPRGVTVTVDAGQTKVYGQADPSSFTYTSSPTLESGDSFTGTLTRVSGENVNIYAIQQGTLGAGSNYVITYNADDFSITPREVTVTVDPGQSKVYGQPDPVLTYQAIPVLETGDSFTGSLARVSGENVNTYQIQQGTLTAGSNYSITFNSDDFNITPRGVTVTVDAGQTKVYGQADPVNFTYNPSPALEAGDSFAGALTRVGGENVNTYAISQGTLTAGSNYTITFSGDDFNITPRAVTIAVDAGQSKIYGQADPGSFTFTPTPALEAGDNFNGALTRVSGENAGNYAIQQGTLSAGGNYMITFNDDNFNIIPIDLSIAADNKTKIVSTSDPALTYTMTSGALINGDMLSGNLARVAGEGLGDYAIQQGTLTAGGNYNINFTDGTLTITDKLLQSITFNTLTDVTYGDATFMLSATGGASGNAVTFSGDNPAVATVSSTGDVTMIGVGTVNITANQAGNAIYAAADPVIRSMTVTQAALTISAEDKSSTYGDASLPALTVAYSGFVNGETESVLTSAPVLNTTATMSSNAGTYPITVSGAVAANYTITHVDGTMTINPATLTLTVDDQSSTYGDAIPGLTVTYAGFVNGEDETVLTSSPAVATTATNTSDAGTYAITANGATADNYTITEVNGTLTIGQAILTVTADDQSKSYGGVNPSFTLSYSGFIGSDDESVLDTAPIGSTSATSTSSVGTYAITAFGGIDNNYTFSYTDGTLTVNQATLTVTTEDQSKTYGASNPGLTLTYAGFQNGDDETSLTTAPTASTTADETSSVGTYAITASGGVADNYTFSYTDGTLTVNQATLTVTANDQVITYGDAIPTLTLTYTGFIGSDDEGVLDTAPTASTNATTTSDAGAYSITVSGGADNNYDFTYIEGTLTINKADQTITFEALTDKTVGDAAFDLSAISNSGLTVTYTSSDETVATVSGSTVTILSAGTTTITASQGGGTNFNAATSVEQTLTVNTNIQDQTISFEALDNQAYGASPIELAGSASSGLTVSYTSSDESVATVSGITVTIHGVGATNITASQSGNDSFTAASDVTQTLTIDPATLTVQADDKTKVYGEANPTLTVTYIGFVNGEDATILETTPTVSTDTDASSEVGTYEITVAGGSASNYAITTANGTMTITKATIVATADDQTMRTGETVPALTISYDGFVNGDTEVDIDIAPSISTAATSSSASGLYDILLSGGEDNNYDLTLINGTLTIETVLGLVLEQSQIMIYPNPVVDKLYIDFPQYLSGEVINVQLFDLEGRQLQSKAVEGYGIELDVRDLPSGILILQMSANGEVIRRRVKKD